MQAFSMLWCLPGGYYYMTRYDHRYERVIHVMKYWLPHVLLLTWYTHGGSPRFWGSSALAWLLFMNLYEVFCRENDLRAVRREARPVLRTWSAPVSGAFFLASKAILTVLLLLGLALVAGREVMMYEVALIGGMVVCFAVHNALPPPFRPITHYLLYFSKGLIFLPPLWPTLDAFRLELYVLFTALFNLAYTPGYIALKYPGLHAHHRVDPSGADRHWWLMPLPYKNVFLAGLALVDWRMLVILLWVDAWTLLEYALGEPPPSPESIRAARGDFDPATIPSIRILGVCIHQFTVPTLHAAIGSIIRRGAKAIVANVNANAMNLAWEQPWYRDFLNQAEYVFCDGHGVMLAAGLERRSMPEKITYADWFFRLAQYCGEQGFTLYLLGARPGVAEAARRRMEAACPGIKVLGTHDGYFDRTPGSVENQRVVEAVNRAHPDILLVAFGMPLQEQWLRENWANLNVKVALTGGAALDYVSGRLRRPPLWMTRYGLEWLGRMLIEPNRLWRRYIVGNPIFLLRVIREGFLTGYGKPRRQGREAQPPEA